MFRGWVRALGLASMLAIGGCGQSASLNVTWDFQGTEPASSGCGQHGVDSVRITGVDDNGDSLGQVGPCTPGQATVSVKPGTWSVGIALLDAQGQDMDPTHDVDGGSGSCVDPSTVPPATGMAQVTTDVPGSVLIHLTPLPACQDGVDNDGDGRVDLDDPNCNNDRCGTSE